MATKTQIANRAISKLGEERVSNVDTDNIKAAKVMRYNWDIVRDALLTAYPWNFAVTRTQLAADTDAPAWGFSKKYTLPTDFLALLEIRDNPDYRLESDTSTGGLRIVTNQGGPLYILYIRRVENTAEYDPLFVDAFATKLAYEACEEITDSTAKKAVLAQEFERNIKMAYASDAIQEKPQERETDTWILAREDSVIYDEIDYNATST